MSTLGNHFLLQLFKTHVDSVERTKMLMGGDRIMEMGASPRGRLVVSCIDISKYKNTNAEHLSLSLSP